MRRGSVIGPTGRRTGHCEGRRPSASAAAASERAGPLRGGHPYDGAEMLRFRNLALVLLATFGIYALLPKSRKGRLAGKAREFGKALIVSLVLYWVLILSRMFFAR